MSKSDKTSPPVARKAAKAPGTKSSSAPPKSIAGSSLSRTAPRKTTSDKTAARAGKVLQKKSSPAVKSLSAGVLSQRPTTKKKSAPAAAGKKMDRHVSDAGMTQHVSTRRTSDGKLVRVVLAPFRGGSLRRDRVESVVLTVLARHKKK